MNPAQSGDLGGCHLLEGSGHFVQLTASAQGRLFESRSRTGRFGRKARAWTRWHSHQREREQFVRAIGRSAGLSSVEGEDPESVDELIEEGNALEADVVTGVEGAGNADEK
jgi:hypothetical protein